MARTFLTQSEINEKATELAVRKPASLKDYQDGEGWQDWMNEFTDAPDGEECTEVELANIEKAQKEIWEKANSMSIIACSCDPYNAGRHYNGEKVLRRNGQTPVQWVIEVCDSKEEAKEKLYMLCLDSCGDQSGPEDSDSIAAFVAAVCADEDCEPEDVDTSWYKGEGVYCSDNNVPVMLKGETSFDDDVLHYSIL